MSRFLGYCLPRIESFVSNLFYFYVARTDQIWSESSIYPPGSQGVLEVLRSERFLRKQVLSKCENYGKSAQAQSAGVRQQDPELSKCENNLHQTIKVRK